MWACQLNDGKTNDDLNRLVDAMNEWHTENGLSEGKVLWPFLHSDYPPGTFVFYNTADSLAVYGNALNTLREYGRAFESPHIENNDVDTCGGDLQVFLELNWRKG